MWQNSFNDELMKIAVKSPIIVGTSLGALLGGSFGAASAHLENKHNKKVGNKKPKVSPAASSILGAAAFGGVGAQIGSRKSIHRDTWDKHFMDVVGLAGDLAGYSLKDN